MRNIAISIARYSVYTSALDRLTWMFLPWYIKDTRSCHLAILCRSPIAFLIHNLEIQAKIGEMTFSRILMTFDPTVWAFR